MSERIQDQLLPNRRFPMSSTINRLILNIIPLNRGGCKFPDDQCTNLNQGNKNSFQDDCNINIFKVYVPIRRSLNTARLGVEPETCGTECQMHSGPMFSGILRTTFRSKTSTEAIPDDLPLLRLSLF
ncbi:hypothetical protein CEXT_808601 [Caerostris extrusa]|uniref:Uncharacterized protein n=1 Tax=Caerostris extrusa TaxID=172846 RepID=A0AAV4SR72_CAEEX|nr:hypothetical protein CEXT_808601 [Caerostris extrusa]